MNSYDLDNLIQELFYFKTFENKVEQIKALQRDKIYLLSAIDRLPKNIKFYERKNKFKKNFINRNVYDFPIRVFDFTLNGLTSICVEKDLVYLQISDNFIYYDMLIILSILLGKIQSKIAELWTV